MPMIGGTSRLNRMSDRRSDPAWLGEHLTVAGTRFIVLAGLKAVIRSNEARTTANLAWFTRADIQGLGLPIADSFFLGLDEDGNAVFAVCVPEHIANHAPGGLEKLRPAVDVRTLAMQGVISNEDLAIIGQARALAGWHQNARHCGHCGGTTNVKDGGWRRKCWACGQSAFPRTDPVVIMLITHGDNCLLAHEHRYEEKMYSALAGFVEHGEDIEHAVRREVMEEAGLKVGEVSYVASQPWPFPHSLMIGCRGEALTAELRIDKTELADARWFSREETASMLERCHGDGLYVPGKHAIANWLINGFVKGEI